MDMTGNAAIETPTPGVDAIEILPGIQWARIDLGAYYLRHTNVYGFRGQEGWTLVDTGLPGPDGEAQWNGLLDGPFSGGVERIVCTHNHPDHIGQVAYLQRTTGAGLWMSRREWAAGRAATAAPTPEARETMAQYMLRAGLDPAQIASLARGRGESGITSMGSLPDAFHELSAGDRLQLGADTWTVEIDGGHSPAPASFVSDDGRAVMVGDQLLPHLYPFIGLSPDDPEGDPLAQFFTYLNRMQRFAPDVLALPGHGEPFRNIPARAAKIADHHARRLERLLVLLAEPRTMVEALPAMFNRPMEGFFLTIGLTEAASHLRHLVRRGEVDTWRDDSGRDLFRRR